MAALAQREGMVALRNTGWANVGPTCRRQFISERTGVVVFAFAGARRVALCVLVVEMYVQVPSGQADRETSLQTAPSCLLLRLWAFWPLA